MLRQLEAAWESVEPAAETPFNASDLPSGDELMAELEQFLRDQRDDT
jgi:hypothetical protein